MKSCTLRRLLCSHFCREYDCSNNCWLLIIPPVGIRRLATTVTRGNHLMRPAGAEGWSRFPEIAPEKSMMKGTRRFTKYIWAPGNNSRKNVPSHTYQRVLFFNSLTKNMFSSRRALLPTDSNANLDVSYFLVFILYKIKTQILLPACTYIFSKELQFRPFRTPVSGRFEWKVGLKSRPKRR
jgi:hypothetical protein